jgi:hypothetical protein
VMGAKYFNWKNLAEREGFESATKCRFNNMQGHGWHKSIQKAMLSRTTDCNMDCRVLVREAVA